MTRERFLKRSRRLWFLSLRTPLWA